jgi:hypothetical protein
MTAPGNAGESLAAQRRKVYRAMRRSRLMKAVNCWLGRHNPPHNAVFEEMGALMVGGPCTRCTDKGLREITWIGNVSDFSPDSFSEEILQHMDHLHA